jgi:hypothetical protein
MSVRRKKKNRVKILKENRKRVFQYSINNYYNYVLVVIINKL